MAKRIDNAIRERDAWDELLELSKATGDDQIPNVDPMAIIKYIEPSGNE
jgi:hypothetical protein